jgi:hypothetical protein
VDSKIKENLKNAIEWWLKKVRRDGDRMFYGNKHLSGGIIFT